MLKFESRNGNANYLEAHGTGAEITADICC